MGHDGAQAERQLARICWDGDAIHRIPLDEARDVVAQPPPHAATSLGALRFVPEYADATIVLPPPHPPMHGHRLALVQDAVFRQRMDGSPGVLSVTVQELAMIASAYTGGTLRRSPSGEETPWHARQIREHLLRALRAGAGEEVDGDDNCVAAAHAAAAAADVVIVGASGERLRAHRAILAWRSDWFQAAFRAAERTGGGMEVSLAGAVSLPGLAAHIVRYLYTGAPEELEALLEGNVVTAALVAAQHLMLDDLARAAEERMVQRLDGSNASAVFHAAQSVQRSQLAQAALERMCTDLDEAESSDLFQELVPQTVRVELRALARASRTNPLCSGAGLSSGAELVAMLREAVDDRVSRHVEAVQRQAQAWALHGEGSATVDGHRREAAGLVEVDKRLEAEGRAIERLRAFTAEQSAIFDALGTTAADHGVVQDAAPPLGSELTASGAPRPHSPAAGT